MNQVVKQVLVVAQAEPATNQVFEHVALFNAAGDPLNAAEQVETQADSVAGSVGALVTDFNALLAKLKAAGVMAS